LRIFLGAPFAIVKRNALYVNTGPFYKDLIMNTMADANAQKNIIKRVILEMIARKLNI